jgi:soluble lytic murein transglycosylase
VSNRPRPPPAFLALVLLTWIPLTAEAQSPELLREVRVHGPAATEHARSELAACESEPCARRPNLALLTAVLSLSDGAPALAAELLERHPPPAGLEAFHAWYQGEAQFYAHLPGAGLPAFERAAALAPEGSALEKKAQARHAEVLAELGEPRRALPILDGLLKQGRSPELLLQRARALRASGKEDAACTDLRKIATGWPTHPACEEALRLLGPSTLTAADLLVRARGLMEAGATRSALDALDEARTAAGGREPPHASVMRARLLFALGKPEDADVLLTAAQKAERRLQPEITWLRARRRMRANDNEGALVLARQVIERHPKSDEAEDARYFSGWLNLQLGRFADAADAFEAFVESHPRERRADEARWLRAFSLLRSGAYPAALAAMKDFPRHHGKSTLLATVRYWEARTRQLASEPRATVLAAYARVRREHPETLYAALASARLAALGERPAPLFPERPTDTEGKLAAAFALPSVLSSTGLFADAAAELRTLVPRVGSAEALACGHALRGLGDHASAYLLAVRHLWGEAYVRKDPRALSLLYPRAFRESVESAAASHRVDPHLVWAIMRRESAFKPEVVSAADARGLMQIIPPTAAQIAAELRRPLAGPDALYAPELNIDFGAWYLSALWKRFGHPALVAAAYNAGPRATLRWLEERGTLELDLFVETIPYKETRGYVKQVVTDYLLYQLLYLGQEAALSLQLPRPSADGVAF